MRRTDVTTAPSRQTVHVPMAPYVAAAPGRLKSSQYTSQRAVMTSRAAAAAGGGI